VKNYGRSRKKKAMSIFFFFPGPKRKKDWGRDLREKKLKNLDLQKQESREAVDSDGSSMERGDSLSRGAPSKSQKNAEEGLGRTLSKGKTISKKLLHPTETY